MFPRLVPGKWIDIASRVLQTLPLESTVLSAQHAIKSTVNVSIFLKNLLVPLLFYDFFGGGGG